MAIYVDKRGGAGATARGGGDSDIVIANPDGTVTVIEIKSYSPRMQQALRGMDQVRKGLASVDEHLQASQRALREAGLAA